MKYVFIMHGQTMRRIDWWMYPAVGDDYEKVWFLIREGPNWINRCAAWIWANWELSCSWLIHIFITSKLLIWKWIFIESYSSLFVYVCATNRNTFYIIQSYTKRVSFSSLYENHKQIIWVTSRASFLAHQDMHSIYLSILGILAYLGNLDILRILGILCILGISA